MEEHEQQRQLTRMRAIATGLLLLMVALFIATGMRSLEGWLGYVHAFSEAAMVGALADWFAVTALFRRPLGLPIPHTAIIPNNKDRIGNSIANFLEHNFMTREVLAEELKPMDFAQTAADWLAAPENARTVAQQTADAVPALIHLVGDREVGPFIQEALSKGLGNTRYAPMLAQVLSALVANGRHQLLFDHVVGVLAQALEQNRDAIRRKFDEKSPRWIPRVIDERIFARMLQETHEILEEMRAPESSWRVEFQSRVEQFIARLNDSEHDDAWLDQAIQNGLAHPLFRDYAQKVWQDLRQRVLDDIAAPDSWAVGRLEQVARELARALQQDPAMRAKLNDWLRAVAAEAISSRRRVIADLIRRVVKKWDADTVSRKFELYVGKDLQYIRINGTLVGGLVGLGLHLISGIFPV